MNRRDHGTTDTVLGWVHPGHVTAGPDGFLDSLLRMLDHDGGHGVRIAGWHGVNCSANISAGRNQIVERFLTIPADWLLMIDTDMVWPADALDRLLAAADPDTAPIVGGLCFAKERHSGDIWPTLFEVEPVGEDLRFFRFHSWPTNTMLRVNGTGAAFLLVHRRVFELIRDKRFSAAYPWFQETENSFGRISEDLTFCLRAQACGFPIHVHTGVQVGHRKTHVVTARDYLAQQMMVDRGGGGG